MSDLIQNKMEVGGMMLLVSLSDKEDKMREFFSLLLANL